MLANPMDVLKAFPVRKSGKQKQAFRDAVQGYAQGLGYRVSIEKGSFGSRNVVIGDPEKAKYLVTAHYDTPARMFLPNLITPCNPVTFLAYQIIVAVIMILPAIGLGILTGIVTHEKNIALLVYLAALVADIWLMMLGPANPSNANDNTSGVVTVLEIARSMPEIHRDKVCFVLFDLEEAGLIGSSSYRRAHKKVSQNQVVLNLDCVGDGNEIIFFPGKKLKKDKKAISDMKYVGGWFGEKHISVRDKGFSVYPSDQGNFPLGVGIAAFHKAKFAGPYCSRIHTAKDTVLDETNVNLLRAALITYMTGSGNA